MRSVRDLIAQVAGDNVTVLLLGETGVGKEVVAHALHLAPPRASHLAGLPSGTPSRSSPEVPTSVRRRGPWRIDHVLERRFEGDPARQQVAASACEHDHEADCGIAIGCMGPQG